MQALYPLLIGNTAVALGLALVAWGCGRWGRPALAHVVWLLVLVKLLTPPLWRVEVMEARGIEPAPAPVAVNVAAPLVDVRVPAKAQAAERAVAAMPIASSFSSPAPHRSFTTTHVVLSLWLAGSVVMLLVAGWRVVRFTRVLRRGTPADDALRKEVERLASRIDLYRVPRTVIVDQPISPMLWFVGGRPWLVLPRGLLNRMNAEQRAGVIAHELAHLKRRDHWVRLLELPATVLLWWHPLVWVARRGLREAEEQCCDAWAVSVVPGDARRSYADALVDALEMISGSRLPVGATGLGQLGTLQRRLAMIVTQSPPKSVSWAGRVVVVGLLGVVLIAPVSGQAPGAPGRPFAADPSAPPAATARATAPAAVDDETRQAIVALLDAAQDRDPNVSQAARAALSQFGPAAVPVLIESLNDPRRGEVATILLTHDGPAAVDALIAALQSRDAVVRGHALQALDFMVSGGQPWYGGAMGMGASFADPAMMEDPGMYGGMPAAGPQGGADVAARLIEPVSKVAADADPAVRRRAIQLLFKIAQLKPDEALVAPLLAALKDGDTQVRMHAAHGLGRLGPLAAGAVDALAAAVAESDLSLRLSALDALASMGPNAKGAMGTVVAALKAPEPQVRSAAARALGAMQAPPPPAGPMPRGGEMGVPGGFAPPAGAAPVPGSAPQRDAANGAPTY
jgi:beta-lactamase regulating signal transducer with metallopeptidase domain/HEAT repeat protein